MYFRHLLLFMVFAAFHFSAYSQQQEAFQMDLSHNVRVFDASGKIFENPNADVAGSPFFITEWKYGYVTLNNDKMYSKRLLRLNFQSQQIHYLDEKNIEMTLPAGSVKEIVIADSSRLPVMQYRFQSGFPSIDNQNEKSFYLFLSKGKISLLESFRKNIIVDKNELTGEVNKEFRTYEDYYFFTGAAILRIKKDKTSIIEILNDKRDQVRDYINTNKLNLKSTSDIQKIVDYYNSLQ